MIGLNFVAPKSMNNIKLEDNVLKVSEIVNSAPISREWDN
jgi:hypothetical protein